jgi:putative ABC transport system permease protein
MIQLLKIWSFSHYRLLKANTLLTLLGIAFGVAIFTAVQIANENIRDSFRWTIEQIAGKGEIEIQGGPAGFSEEEIVRIGNLPGIKETVPMIFQQASAGEEKPTEVVVLGVDFIQYPFSHDLSIIDPGSRSSPDLYLLLEPGSIVVSPLLANRFHLKSGSKFILRAGGERIQTEVAGILQFQNDLPPPYGGYFAMMDIASAQLLFHKIGKLDRIDLLLEENVPEGEVARRLASLVPGLQIQNPGNEKKMVDSLLGSFNLNIKALSEVTILVGMFLVYNTLSFLLVRRKVEIGILRSVGVSGKELFFLILFEAFLLGLVGSMIGIGLGLLISRSVLKAVSLTITSLYLKVYTETISFPLMTGVLALSIGTGVSLLAAAFPAWEASQIPPRDNLTRRGEINPPHRSTSLLLIGAIFLAFSFFLSTLPPYGHRPLFGYLSAVFLLLGLALMIPSTLFLLYKTLQLPVLKNRIVFLKIAGAGFFQKPLRNGISVTALMVSVALLISVTLMIDSFRRTLELWFDQTIKADLVIETKEWFQTGSHPLISPGIADPVKQIEGVAAVDLFREDHLFYQNEPFLLTSRDLEIHRERSQYLFTEGVSRQKLQRAIDRMEVLISERFSLQHHLKEGDLLTLDTPSGAVPFRIGGIFYDYTTQGGKVVIDRSIYLKYWKDDRVNILAVYLEKEGKFQQGGEAMKKRLKAFLDENGLTAISNQEIKTKVMEIFDQTFSITRVLEWITILISLLGVVNMLLANLLDQKREIGILRSIGFSRNQIGLLTLCEALWMTIVASFLGGIGGTALSLILIYVINKQSFFWTIQFDFSWMVYIRTFLVVMLTALAAAYFPARRAAGGNIAESIRYE